MARLPTPTWPFALVVARQGERFLLVREREHGQRWYLPAGRVEPGESLEEGARRETLEESGVRVKLTGLLRIQYTPSHDSARLRAIFVAQPAGDATPLAPPGNEHALEARWVSLAELDTLELRSEEVRYWLREAEAGPIHLVTVLAREG